MNEKLAWIGANSCAVYRECNDHRVGYESIEKMFANNPNFWDDVEANAACITAGCV